eukprot:scaffold282106_cov31-Tisochrysis_lutea.AAC.1
MVFSPSISPRVSCTGSPGKCPPKARPTPVTGPTGAQHRRHPDAQSSTAYMRSSAQWQALLGSTITYNTWTNPTRRERIGSHSGVSRMGGGWTLQW